ncbi:uncharacterized protein P174DRAFT_426047 [Aspergillus novofumigatus IBT 16806]|uniref:Uncharacterized protein n=1 Tax=Aspergillus novofumigatus (strain IBT 16806) TaxID=1392255 RepID=A0A2I1BSQ8_ASPN1|nr:uncharacterized protein P174DRAFT_426047 [Aspergillus novofumigatus IBT 16806]PKX88450.1 hypothetical protein P174DRAFT_426047 [Aspergillus novofumigatus IBT 16806]
MPEFVPYQPGMLLGQGYNSYLQQLRLQEAAIITENKSAKEPPNEVSSNTDVDEGEESDNKEDASGSIRAQKVVYEYSFVKDYHALRETLNLSSGAAVSGWGQSGKVNVEYLDRSEFEGSTLTYQVSVFSENQPSVSYHYSFNQAQWDEWKQSGSPDKPQLIYGDRYISDFITGGHFFARFSIKARNESRKNEIEEWAKTAFQMYGADIGVDEEMRKAVENIEKHAEVKCSIHQEGGTRFRRKGSVTDDGSESSDFLYIKKQADKFYEEAKQGQHKYRRLQVSSALLQQYVNLPNFREGQHFKPHDYRQANEKSRQLFEDFSLYQSYGALISNIGKEQFAGGGAERDSLESRRTDEIHQIRVKVEDISADPQRALGIGFNYLRAEEFYIMVIEAIKKVTYIAQRRKIEVRDSTSDIALPDLLSGAEKLFEFKAYNFPDIIGTKVVSFGRSITDPDSFVCTFGQRVNKFDGWKEESCLWAFPKQLKSIANRAVHVSKSNIKNHIRLELQDKKSKRLFDFYVNV